MSKTLTTIEELIFSAGLDVESMRREAIDNACHTVVELLVQRALDGLAAEWGQDLSDYMIDAITIEMELEDLASEIESCIDEGSIGDALEERYLGGVMERVREQIEEQETEL